MRYFCTLTRPQPPYPSPLLHSIRPVGKQPKPYIQLQCFRESSPKALWHKRAKRGQLLGATYLCFKIFDVLLLLKSPQSLDYFFFLYTQVEKIRKEKAYDVFNWKGKNPQHIHAVHIKNKQNACADELGTRSTAKFRFPARVSCRPPRLSQSISLIKNKPGNSDKNLVLVATKVKCRHGTENNVVVGLDCTTKSPESKSLAVIVGILKCVC